MLLTTGQGHRPQTGEEREGDRTASAKHGAQTGLRFGHGSVAEGPGLPAAHLQPAQLHQGQLSGRPIHRREIEDPVAAIRLHSARSPAMASLRDKDAADGERRQSATVAAQVAMMCLLAGRRPAASCHDRRKQRPHALPPRRFLARVRERVEARADSLALRGIPPPVLFFLRFREFTRPNGTLLRCERRARLKH